MQPFSKPEPVLSEAEVLKRKLLRLAFNKKKREAIFKNLDLRAIEIKGRDRQERGEYSAEGK